VLLACRLAALSALAADYASLVALTQTALDHVARGRCGKAANRPLRAERSQRLLSVGPPFRLWPLGTQAMRRRRAESKRRLAPPGPHRLGGASHSQSSGTDFAWPSSSGGWEHSPASRSSLRLMEACPRHRPQSSPVFDLVYRLEKKASLLVAGDWAFSSEMRSLPDHQV
jgi:hypothetical protein